MFRKQLPIPGFLALLAACCSMTTYVDYDRDVDQGSYRRFAWAESSEPSMEKSRTEVGSSTVARECAQLP